MGQWSSDEDYAEDYSKRYCWVKDYDDHDYERYYMAQAECDAAGIAAYNCAGKDDDRGGYYSKDCPEDIEDYFGQMR